MSKAIGLSVVIPTLGRSSLTRTLKSVMPQLIDGDELIVIADTAGDVWNSRRALMRCRRGLHAKHVWSHLVSGPGNEEGQGYSQREFGVRYADKSHIVFIDDDDIYAEGALALFREHACEVPVIFRMDHPYLGLVWNTPELRFGNVGTPMFVVPNKKSKLGEWKSHTVIGGKPVGGDYEFIRGSVENLGGPIWREEVVAIVNPTLLGENR